MVQTMLSEVLLKILFKIIQLNLLNRVIYLDKNLFFIMIMKMKIINFLQEVKDSLQFIK